MSTPLKCVHEIALTAEPTGLGAPFNSLAAAGRSGGHLTFAGLPALV